MSITAATGAHCSLAELVPGECAGPIHLHHVYPVSAGGDPDGSTVPVCARHHPMLEALARRIIRPRRCPHKPGTHRYREGREECERRLNAVW